MSRVMKRAPGVEIVLFKIHLVVVRLAHLVVVSPGKSNLFPSTVTRMQCVFCLVGPDAGNNLRVADCASDRDC